MQATCLHINIWIVWWIFDHALDRNSIYDGLSTSSWLSGVYGLVAMFKGPPWVQVKDSVSIFHTLIVHALRGNDWLEKGKENESSAEEQGQVRGQDWKAVTLTIGTVIITSPCGHKSALVWWSALALTFKWDVSITHDVHNESHADRIPAGIAAPG